MTEDDLSKLIGKLDYLCKKHGKDSPLGSRYSTLNQQVQNYRKDPNPALAAFMRNTQFEIEQIIKDDGQYIEAHHIPKA